MKYYIQCFLICCILLSTHLSTAQDIWSGKASFYSDSLQGNYTASGALYNKNAFTAAHLTLPFNTKVRVTNLSNNKSVVVIINDRGPYSNNRIIDLSKAAAKEIGLINDGVAEVKLEVLDNYFTR
ncbi:septal ring lytic transglycosylase RlpA family protein [Formosa sediminum]|uniref:Probable endolytic peptidoglycan transglycosylase RlpA n=1 Tax=Formosa sediminum TaxID=2594004 RepID=A0A516GT63_9FLAO|nr:septal ring lytic transglycosylase RlpA family protein [Formosa sediminum]QDO94702.1 septal ring lytic transglycosylase RlpA family protein [Formosa sediminum]